MQTKEGKLIGYARPVSFGPRLKEQLAGLTAANCWNIYADRRRNKEWHQLELALIDCRPGDVFVVYSVLCLGDEQGYLHALRRLGEAGAAFRTIVDRFEVAGAVLPEALRTLEVMTNSLRNARSEAIRRGLAEARAAGRVGGRRRVLPPEKLAAAIEMRATNRYSMSAIAKALGVSRSSLYNAKLTGEKKQPPTGGG